MDEAETRSDYVKNNRDRFAYYGTRQRDRIKLEMVEAYGGKCKRCGNDNPVVLILDHINDDAHIERELYGANARGGHKHYHRLKAQGWPQDRFQLLCANCNMVKEHERRRSGVGERWGDDVPAKRDAVQARLGPQANNKSGFKGVFWSKQRRCWMAHIMIDYKTRHLGSFHNIADAARAYKAKALETWGADANVPSEEEIDRISAEHEAPIQTSKPTSELGL